MWYRFQTVIDILSFSSSITRLQTKVCLNPLVYLKMRESKPTNEQKQTLEHVAHTQTIVKPADFLYHKSSLFTLLSIWQGSLLPTVWTPKSRSIRKWKFEAVSKIPFLCPWWFDRGSCILQLEILLDTLDGTPNFWAKNGSKCI